MLVWLAIRFRDDFSRSYAKMNALDTAIPGYGLEHINPIKSLM